MVNKVCKDENEYGNWSFNWRERPLSILYWKKSRFKVAFHLGHRDLYSILLVDITSYPTIIEFTDKSVIVKPIEEKGLGTTKPTKFPSIFPKVHLKEFIWFDVFSLKRFFLGLFNDHRSLGISPWHHRCKLPWICQWYSYHGRLRSGLT